MLALSACQQLILVALGIAAFSLDVPGGTARLIAAAAATSLKYVAMAITVKSLCRSMAQLTALPGWVRAIAPASPVYWAIDAYRSVLTGEQGIGQTMGILPGFGTLFIAVTPWAFRANNPKRTTR